MARLGRLAAGEFLFRHSLQFQIGFLAHHCFCFDNAALEVFVFAEFCNDISQFSMGFGRFLIFLTVGNDAGVGKLLGIPVVRPRVTETTALGAAYLAGPSDTRNALARAGAECAVAFGVMVLTSGPLWAKKAWGVYWAWDPRLTTTLLSVMVYVAVVVLRAFTGDGHDTGLYSYKYLRSLCQCGECAGSIGVDQHKPLPR